MTAARYFRLGPMPGTPHTRYAILEHGVVVEVVISRPDGTEVDKPASYRTRLREFVGGPVEHGRFHNVPAQIEAEARSRAGQKGARALAERRTLMPASASDAKLAEARQRGQFKPSTTHVGMATRTFRRAAP